MLKRCLDKNDKAYKNYGGRGVTVCRRWQGENGLANFNRDMGARPAGMCLERCNNNGGYSPGNCVWATRVEQARNTRTNLRITYKKRTQCLKAWAEELGINYLTLYGRVVTLRWPVKKAFETPAGGTRLSTSV